MERRFILDKVVLGEVSFEQRDIRDVKEQQYVDLSKNILD